RCIVYALFVVWLGCFYRYTLFTYTTVFRSERHCYFTVTVISSCHCWYSWYRSAINACIRRCIREHWIFSIGYCNDLCMRCSVAACIGGCPGSFYRAVTINYIVGFTIERHCYFTVTVISSCHCWYSWYRSAINACIRRCIREQWIFSIGYCNDLCMRCSVAACIGGCPGSFYRAATINYIVGFTIERHCYFTVTVISSCHCWYSWYRSAINACIRRCIRE